MITTTGIRPPPRPEPSRPRRTGADGFQVRDAGATGGGAAVGGVALGGLLSLQEEPAGERDARALAGGFAVLSALSDLQRDLLHQGGDGGPDDSIRRLDQALAAMPGADDPRLVALTRMVALRARIEQWRHGRG